MFKPTSGRTATNKNSWKLFSKIFGARELKNSFTKSFETTPALHFYSNTVYMRAMQQLLGTARVAGKLLNWPLDAREKQLLGVLYEQLEVV
jgi:hypothetical protein